MIFTYSIHTGKDIQFYIKALDRVESHGPEDLTYPINHFLIDLELELGAAFTERTTYTGIYNISGLGFDMSFRVQCSENYCGPNCTICLAPGYDPSTNSTECICLLNNQCQPTVLPGKYIYTSIMQCYNGASLVWAEESSISIINRYCILLGQKTRKIMDHQNWSSVT